MSRPSDFDVVVAGAGGAGLAAALAAAEAGCSVAVIEREPRFSECCNTALSTAMIPAGGSRWQRDAAIDDSPQRFLHDIRSKTHDSADVVIAGALTSVAPALVEWLAEYVRIPLELVNDFDYPGHSRRRCHSVPDRSGHTLHGELLHALQQRPSIDIVVPCSLVDVSVSGADGAVDGVVTETPDGVRQSVTCKAVVLATNGFGADKFLVKRYLTNIASALYFGGPGSIGTALRIGSRLGADVGYLDAYQGHGAVTVPQSTLLTWAAVMHGAVLVNDRGLRFGNEAAGYSEYAEAVLGQPGGRVWEIFDARIDELCRRFSDYQRCVETGAIREAGNIEELAARTGVPAATLHRTLAAVRGSSRRVDRFGRGWERAEPPLQAPYRYARVTGALFHTQGGLRVDAAARVLRGGKPIGGLYAAGGAAAGISGHGASGYLAGNGLLAALGLGYLAGRSSASLAANHAS